MNTKDLKNLSKDDILEMLGIATSTSSGILRTVGFIAVGAVAGATAALLLAPKTGQELRSTIGRRANKAADDVISSVRAKAEEAQSERG